MSASFKNALPSPEGLGEKAGVRVGLVSRRLMHEQILPHLRRDIVTGRWKSGERLPEPALCQEFGVSRTPMRDALRLLEAEGLVSLMPHVGAVVTEATVDGIGEKVEVLMALEAQAAYKVAAARDPEAIERIVLFDEQMRHAAAAADARTYYRLNDRFHKAIVNGAGNNTLSGMHEKMMWHVHRARHIANEHAPFTTNAAVHHKAIVDAIVAGDAESAARAMREHLCEVGEIITGRRNA